MCLALRRAAPRQIMRPVSSSDPPFCTAFAGGVLRTGPVAFLETTVAAIAGRAARRAAGSSAENDVPAPSRKPLFTHHRTNATQGQGVDACGISRSASYIWRSRARTRMPRLRTARRNPRRAPGARQRSLIRVEEADAERVPQPRAHGARLRSLFRVVDEDAVRVPQPRAHAADAMAQVDAIIALRAFDRPVMNREDDGIALPERHDFGAALHARPLLGQHKLDAGEVFVRTRQQDR